MVNLAPFITSGQLNRVIGQNDIQKWAKKVKQTGIWMCRIRIQLLENHHLDLRMERLQLQPKSSGRIISREDQIISIESSQTCLLDRFKPNPIRFPSEIYTNLT